MKNLNKLRHILFVCCIVFIAQYSKAGNAVALAIDTVKVKEKERFVAGNYGFNAIDYLMQNRYRHGDSIVYNNSRFFSHFYVGGSFSYDFITTRHNFKYKPGTSWGISIGKELTRDHALSLLFQYGSNNDDKTNVEFERYAFQLNHHFNFTRYYLGYNPWRKFEISSVLGLGIQHGSIWDEDYTSPYFLLGVQGAIRLGNRVNLVVEPHVAIGGEGYNGAPDGYYYSNYNISYGARAAINYTFDNELSAPQYAENFITPKNYLFITTGLQSLNADIEFINTLAPSVTIGYGRWLAKRFALQLSTGWSAGAWIMYKGKSDVYNRYSKSQYFYGRIEGVYNLFSTFNDISDSKNAFSINVLAGYEFGKSWKYRTNLENQTTHNYYGFTGALRFRYHSSENKVLYFEPRVTFGTYDKDYGHGYKETKEYFLDSRYTLALGMEYGLGSDDNSGSTDFVLDEPQMSVFASLGPNYVFNRGSYGDSPLIRGSYGLGFEYQPFSVLGARFMFDYSVYAFNRKLKYNQIFADRTTSTTGIWEVNNRTYNAMLDLKLDVTSLLYGYNAERDWHVSMYAGPVLSRYNKVKGSLCAENELHDGATAQLPLKAPKRSFWGLHTAINTRYDFTNHWGVFGELDLRLYDNFFLADPEHIDYHPLRTLAFRVGANYKFNAADAFTRDDYELEQSRNYLFFSTGLQSLNADVDFFKTLGPSVSMGYGHWFSNVFGAQLTAGWSAGAWQRIPNRTLGYVRYDKQQYAFTRAEMMFNILSNVVDSKGLSLTALAGVEYGKTWRYRLSVDNQTEAEYTGFTGAFRFKYHTGHDNAIFVEPRVTFAHFHEEYLPSSGTQRAISSRYNLALGMEYGLGRDDSHKSNSGFVLDESRLSVSASVGPNYVFNRGIYDGESTFSATTAFGIEYQPFSILGARLMFDYSVYGFNSMRTYGLRSEKGKYSNVKSLCNTSHKIYSGIFDVKLDLSSIVNGYDDERKWETALYLGPIISKYADRSVELDDRVETPEGSTIVYPKTPDENHWGFHTAFNTKYNINNKCGVFGEVDLRINKNKFMGEQLLDYNPVRTMSFRVGMSYNIK